MKEPLRIDDVGGTDASPHGNGSTDCHSNRQLFLGDGNEKETLWPLQRLIGLLGAICFLGGATLGNTAAV